MRVPRFRADLKRVTKIRLREARRLLAANEFCGTYHFAGIPVECAIKACIAKLTRRFEFPDKAYANECFTHDPTALIKLAGLMRQLEVDCRLDTRLSANWIIVKDWKVDSRYDHNISGALARDMYSAVASRKHGVLRWLRQHW